MSNRPVVLVAGRHRPHEQLLLLYSSLLGIAYLTTAPAPESVTASHPQWTVTTWAVALIVSGVAGLIGCWWRGERGLGLELGGLLINAGTLVIYATAVFASAGMRALWSGGIVLAWALANLWRAGQVGRELKAIRGQR